MTSLKYEIPLLDRNTGFVLWQVKMQAVLAQMDLEEALLGVDKMASTLTEEEKKYKDRKCLYAHRLEEGASVHEHLTVFKEILSNLEAMEVQYDKENLMLILFCSLPSSYSTFRDTILYSRKSLTVDEGEGLIVRERQDRNANDDRRRTQKQNPRGKSKNKIKREAMNQKGKQSKNFGEANVVEDYNDGELLVASVNNSKVSEEWILDSGCTFHMSPNRDWFITYETMSKGVILMGNNASCKIAELKRNLIPLSTLDSKGYRHTAESGVLKISKGSLVVMKGQRKTAKLYVLQSSTVTGDAAIASSSLLDDEITKLWHMRLGHMSENDMVELSKRELLDGQGICKLKFYNGLEFYSNEFNRLCKSEGIVRYLTVRQTPQQNVIAERMNRTIMEKAEAASTAYFLINRSPFVAIEKKTPQEVWSGNPTNYSDLKIFGCPAYAHVDNGKLESRSIKCVFLGYKAGVKGYKLWYPENRKVVISRDVVFNETAMLLNLSLKDSYNKENQKQKYTETDLVAYALNVAKDIDSNQETSNYSEAVSCEDSVKWMFAMQEEMESLHKNKTWDLVKLSKGVDFTDVFSPVVKHSSIRALLGIVAMHDLELEQLDFETVTKKVVQEKGYIEKVLCRFNIQSAKPVSTPLAAHLRLSLAFSPQSDDEIEYMSHVPYSV
ncbi:hypothetical protein CXB51_019698 [Gossypium anomalum]|uniref:Integrase catalytic domain-containing protein n=1 Tax=Gossypium anomalum TaxID=47600 RepID=A0A8J6D012_9ROSI|nr:hypothetical protein CXB51_019698 [Gossypium anomalum]